MNDLMIWSCFQKRSDSSVDWISEEYSKPDGTPCIVNIYETIDGYLELTNSQWQIFISSYSNDEELLSVLEFMALAEENILKKSDIIDSFISKNS